MQKQVTYKALDYDPFGFLMPSRSFTGTSGYKFGFQGQEKENDVTNVEGGHIAFKYRVHDTRLGRFLSRDPLASNFPWNSPYSFAENKVIQFIELEGREKSQPAYFDLNLGWITAIDNAGAFLKSDEQMAAMQADNNYQVWLNSPSSTNSNFTNAQMLQFSSDDGGAGSISAADKLTAGGVMTSAQQAYQNELIDNGTELILGAPIAKKALKGEEITKADVGLEVLGILPIFKIASKTLTVVKYGGKHAASIKASWKSIVKGTQNGSAKFLHDTDIETLTKKAWDDGVPVNNGKTWKVFDNGETLGASAGKETQYMRVELTPSTNELHASPITKKQFDKLTKVKE